MTHVHNALDPESKIWPLDWKNVVRYWCLWSMTTIIWLDCVKWVIKVFKTLSKLVNIWSFMIGGYNDTHPSCTRVRFKIWQLDWKSGIKYWFWWILSSVNDSIGRMWPIKISWCYSKMTHVHNALDSNPKSDCWIGRMWWDIGVREVWQQSGGRIVRNE